MDEEQQDRPVVVVAALLANIGMAAAKLVAFAFTRSSGMLAEGLHSVADTSNQLLLLWGRRRADLDETPEHPFGFGGERYFWAFLVSVVFFLLGGLYSLYEGVREVLDPEPLQHPWWAVGVLLVGMVLEGLSLRTAVREAQAEGARPGGLRRWLRYIREVKEPDKLVVLLEDSAAEVGLLIALTGILLTVWTGNAVFDAAASIGIGLLLGAVAYVLARELRSLLIGERASVETERVIRQTILADGFVERIVDLRTLHLGPDAILVAARIELEDHLVHDVVADRLDRIEASLRGGLPEASYIYLEPQRPGHPDPGRPAAER